MKKKTNVQFVKHLMESSQYGVLTQAFVIEAVAKYAEAVIKEHTNKKTLDTNLIHNKAWLGIANEVQKKINKQYGGN